jgi:peptide/nickel transport system permease protein
MTSTMPIVDPARPVAAPSWRAAPLGRLLRTPMGIASTSVCGVLVLIAVAAPLLAPDDPAQTFATLLSGPSWHHLLGIDDLGRDELSRLVFGIRASLEVGVLSVLLASVVGVPLGMIAGFYGRWVDTVVSRLTDTVLAFPSLILAVGMAAILGPSLTNVTIALAIGFVPTMVRVARGETMLLRERDYVRAAVANGVSDPVLLHRHILPGALPALIVQATVALPAAIIGEAGLSFLGLGVQPPGSSLGVMLANAQQFYTTDPLLAILPGVTIVVAALAFNLFGDSLRDALDPKRVAR